MGKYLLGGLFDHLIYFDLVANFVDFAPKILAAFVWPRKIKARLVIEVSLILFLLCLIQTILVSLRC